MQYYRILAPQVYNPPSLKLPVGKISMFIAHLVADDCSLLSIGVISTDTSIARLIHTGGHEDQYLVEPYKISVSIIWYQFDIANGWLWR